MFDVFLSHNNKDKAAVEAIAGRLHEVGINPFLDKWQTPGTDWLLELEHALVNSATVAVFLGPSGLSPWHNKEVQVALFRSAASKEEYRIIPVLLPGSDPGALPSFLAVHVWVDFRGGLGENEPFQRLVAGIKGVSGRETSFTLPDEPVPYRGLFKFDDRHKDRFFGREEEIATVLRRLDRSSFEAVIGASGAGKSSLVLAGVVPRLSEHCRSWDAPIRAQVFMPGSSPVRALANQVAGALLQPEHSLDGADQLERRMFESPNGLLTAAGTWSAGKPGTLVLVIDQMEELFTHRGRMGGPEVVTSFAANLRAAVEGLSGKLRVIATLRADFLERCMTVDPLRALLQDHNWWLGPMTPEGLRDAIRRPIINRGANFEAGVVSALMQEMRNRPEMLPLLEHALERLWSRRQGVWLTSAAYDEMEGVTGALRKHADECWNRLSEEDRPVAREMLLKLVSVGDSADTRRRVTMDALYTVGVRQEQIDRVLQILSGTEGRLLIVDGAGVEVAHEVLITEWPRLRDWVNGARRRLRLSERLAEAAREWNEAGRVDDYLLAGARLLEVEEVFGSEHLGLHSLEVDYIRASASFRYRQAHEAEQSRRRELEHAQAIAQLQAAKVREQEEANDRLRRERNLARSRELAGAAMRELRVDPQVALLLIQEAYRLAPTELVNEAWRRYREQAGRVTIKVRSGHLLRSSFSPDGKTIVTAEQDGVVRVWNATSGLLVTALEGHSGPVSTARFSPDGMRLVSSGQDGTSRVWDVTGGKVLRELNAHPGGATSAAFSPDGRRVVTTGRDGITRIWDAAEGALLRALGGHSGEVTSAAFSPDGRRVVTAGRDQTARVWDPADGEEMRKLEGHEGEVMDAAFSPDGRQVVTAGGDETARLWSVARGRELRALEGHKGKVLGAAFSPDGRRVVTGGSDGTARVWDAVQGLELRKLEGHSGEVMSVAFGPDGRRVVTAGDDGTTRVWDVTGENETRRLTNHSGPVRGARFTHDGKRVMTAAQDGTVRVWDTASGAELASMEGPTANVSTAGFNSNGDLVVTAGVDGTGWVWDVSSGTEIGKLKGHRYKVWSALFSPDGKQVVTTCQDGTVFLWDTSGKMLGSFVGHVGTVSVAVFSSDGLEVVTAGDDGTVRIWATATGRERRRLEDRLGEVWSAAFSPGGEWVAAGGASGFVCLWNAVTGVESRRLEGHWGGVMSVAFSPDGRLLVTAARDGTACIWDVDSGQELGRLAGHSGGVNAEFSPDGRHVVTSGEDGVACIWPSWTWEPADDQVLAFDAGRALTAEERRGFLHEDPQGS